MATGPGSRQMQTPIYFPPFREPRIFFPVDPSAAHCTVEVKAYFRSIFDFISNYSMLNIYPENIE